MGTDWTSASNAERQGNAFRFRSLLPGISMNNEPRLLSVDQFDRDPYASSRARDRDLNAAIMQAEISESFEEYLEIFDVFYGDDIEVTSETREEPIRVALGGEPKSRVVERPGVLYPLFRARDSGGQSNEWD